MVGEHLAEKKQMFNIYPDIQMDDSILCVNCKYGI